jgi:ketosteroid isomerase-like protein
MGWTIPWFSSYGTGFNRDFGVGPEKPEAGKDQDGETFGLSVLLRDGGKIYRTYFTNGRGVEALGSVWTFLDLTPFGRQEKWEDSPQGYPQTPPYQWWRRHDEYETKAPATRLSEEAQVRRCIESWASALRAKNLDGVMSHYTPDLLAFDLAPPLQHHRDDVAKGLAEWFATWDGPIGYEMRDLEITADGGIAFAHSLNHLTGKRTDGQKTDVWLRATVCFRKVAGHWMEVHEHGSVPFYMDGSFRAAVDLEP